MTYKTSSSLVESGVGWLGDIPSHWAVIPAKALFSLRTEKAYPDDVHLTPSQKFGVLPQTDYMEVTGNRVVLNLMDSGQMKHVEPNDFVSHLRSFQGGLELSRIQGKVSGAYTVLKLRKDQNPDYWKYALKSDTYIQALQTTTDQLRDGQSIRLKEFAQIPLPLLPRSEQDAIVKFLDKELGLIDRMLEKQREIKNLLAERKTAYVLRLISKGTRKGQSLKDSGLPWLGSIPKSWELVPIRRLSRVQRGASPRPIDDERYFDPEGEYGWVRISDVTASGMFLNQTEQKLSALGASLSVKMKPGDLFLSIAGSYGKAAIAGVKVCIHDGFVWFPELSKRKINNEWLYWVFESGKLFDGLGKLGTQVNLNTSIVGDVKIGVPSYEEQIEISEHLRDFVLEEERLSAANEYYTKLLQERRAALISVAVTGKIDVRGM
jgi:type I restriction enzyme S subunit